MRGLYRPLLLLTIAFTAGMTVLALLAARSAHDAPAADTARLNDAVQRLSAVWPHPETAGLGDMADQLRVVDLSGDPVPLTGGSGEDAKSPDASGRAPDQAPRASGLQEMQWTGEHRPLAGPVVVDGRVVAWAFLDDDHATTVAAHQRAFFWASAATLTAGFLLLLALLMWINARVLVPFRKLERFASRVAGGDLAAPLEMDRGNAFGAWTESFDLLRTELAASREREAAVQASKEALTAQIGHDLRTPIATISATAELLQLTEDSPAARERLQVIQSKSSQVDGLVSDLFRAHDDEIAALSVNPADLGTDEVEVLLREADHRRLMDIEPLPAVLVRADRLRLAQVIDNVVQNSYKYAGTPIRVSGRIEEEALRLSLTDAGPGVDPDETGLIFARGQRGRNAAHAAGAPGQGLGLFTCAQLMERMGGHIEADLPDEGGLTITLSLPLA